MEYSYPIRHDWSTQEIIEVVSFFEMIEKAYETKVERAEFMQAYRKFKGIVPSMAEEKTLFKEFEEASGLNSYHIVKLAKEANDGDAISGQ
ncbi:UPF0223 family protein [Sporosarcina sp. Te-1]|uniref:UPF0223 family protein n=1 Tax=Sporosarcina sp. Te-1 TaxID=2818390 RepID=UPI001A9D8719|nr:UPF0223 family protein [Sporosarcina sp. Te-1]QTD42453.1 UPF0223 family protein [Sporosarcina sp. Te-1]